MRSSYYSHDVLREELDVNKRWNTSREDNSELRKMRQVRYTTLEES